MRKHGRILPKTFLCRILWKSLRLLRILAKRLSRSGPDMKPSRNSAAGADEAAGEKEGEAVGGETGGGEVAESEKPPLPAKGGANLIDAAKRMAGIAQAKRLAAAQRRKIRSLTTIQRRGNKVAELDAGAAFGELALMYRL